MYRLLRVKQGKNEEQVPITQNWWFIWLTKRSCGVLKNWSKFKLPLSEVVEQDIPKITLFIRCERFKFVMMLFRLINTLTVLMELMNKVFHNCLDKFIVVFINDILVYSKSQEEHAKHLRFTLQRVREKQLYVEFSKCELWLERSTRAQKLYMYDFCMSTCEVKWLKIPLKRKTIEISLNLEIVFSIE